MSRYLRYISFLFFCTSALSKSTWAQSANWVSGTEAPHLVELFSSEGCSSCPPADRWLSSLRQNESLWKSFVPLEFHVDYWNQLGWVDRNSKSAFTQRQRQYAQSWNRDTVYTPGVVL